jgi:hypothetical protein
MELTPEQKELVELAMHVPEDHIPKAKQVLQQLADPFWLALKSAPYDDEPATPDEISAIAEAKAEFARDETIPHEQILSEFGIG